MGSVDAKAKLQEVLLFVETAESWTEQSKVEMLRLLSRVARFQLPF